MAIVEDQQLKKRKTGLVRFHRLSGISALGILILVLAVVFLLSFVLGRYAVSPLDVIKILFSHIFSIDHTWKSTAETVVMNIRLPRILAAMLIGACLALAGASFQGLFRNPLVSPDILGVTSGAGFGAALAILLNADSWGIQIAAFAFALLAVGIAYSLSRLVKGNPTLSLILSGMVISSLFGAFLAMAKYVADPINQLPAITFWLMGSLASIKTTDLLFAAIPMLVGMVILILIRWRFNVLAMGEEEAKALGVNTNRLRSIIVICCTLITASGVCIAGTIGWVGLVIPHIGRMLVGPDHQRLIPVCVFLGAIYLLIIDNIARAALNVEIPIGILTAIIGAPFFIYLLNRGSRGWA
jgi:iron complex transport system permease protein